MTRGGIGPHPQNLPKSEATPPRPFFRLRNRLAFREPDGCAWNSGLGDRGCGQVESPSTKKKPCGNAARNRKNTGAFSA